MSEIIPTPGATEPTSTAPVSVSAPAATVAAKPAEPKTPRDASIEAQLKLMLSYGVHFGHQTSRWNPKMKKYIFTTRNGIHIIDLLQTVDLLAESKSKVREIAARGGKVLFVCTKRQGQQKTMETAQSCGMPFIVSRWVGGMFTNFRVISKQIKEYIEIKAKSDSGELDVMLKKERSVLNKKLERMNDLYQGLTEVTRLPDMIFIIDPHRERIAIKEATTLHVPIMASVDTNCNPDEITFPIPANDDAIRSINFVLDEVGAAINEGRAEFIAKGAKAAAAAAAAKPETVVEEIKVNLNDVTEVAVLEQQEELEAEKQLRRLQKGVSSSTGHKVTQPQVVISELKAPKIAAVEFVTDIEPEVVAPVVTKTAITEETFPGFTSKVLEALTEKFKTLETLRKASEEDLQGLPGVGPATTKKILASLK